MNLGIDGYTYKDLHDLSRLRDLATTFDQYVEEHDAELFKRFEAYRRAMQNGEANGGIPAPEESALLIGVGRYLSMFLTRLFHVEPGATALRTRAERDAEVARFKREFVAKRVAKIQTPVPAPAAEVLISTIAPGAAPG